VLEFALSRSRFVFLGAVGVIVGLTLMLFILYFFFRDGEEMAARGLHLVPLDARHKERLVAHLSEVTRAVVYGTLLTALVQGALVGLAFVIARLPSPIVFGTIAAVASLIPVVGTGLVVAPAAFVLAVQGRWVSAIFMAAWGILLVGSADNFLRPLFISGRAEISTLPVFFGVIGGVAAFGPIGLFLGPVVVALALALIRFAEEARSGELPPA
jgi:predicted PurR-regulated permease PerM